MLSEHYNAMPAPLIIGLFSYFFMGKASLCVLLCKWDFFSVNAYFMNCREHMCALGLQGLGFGFV